VTCHPSARAVWVWPLACLTFALLPDAVAEEGVVGAPPPATKIEISVVGKPGDLRWARSLVGSNSLGMAAARWTRAERFDVRELFETAAVARANLLACWLDLSDPKRGRLYFVAPSGQRFLLRDVELSGHQSEVDRASLAEVLELSVAALLENERAGLTRAETETLIVDRQATERVPGQPVARPAPATAIAPSATAAVRPAETQPLHGAGVLFAEQVISADFPLAQRVGVEGSLGRRFQAGWLAGVVAGEYQFSVSAQNADIGMRLSSWLACVALEAGHLRERPGEDARFWWRSLFGRLGAGVDFSRVSPQLGTQAMAATLAPAHWSAAFVVRGTLGTSWALGAQAALDVQIFADAFPTAVHYDVNREGSVETAFSPWRVRPGLALGLAYR
jgi:hypothetical protein